jgi:hypothetical protein
VLKDLNDCLFDAFRRRRPGRQGKRKRRRGRPSKAQRRARARRGLVSAQAHFLWKHRHLIVRSPESLSDRERQYLMQMLASLPAFGALWNFVAGVYQLFDTQQSPHQARCRGPPRPRCPSSKPTPTWLGPWRC